MKLSIIIASYNRSDSLISFLRQIGDQIVPATVDWEVLIVDNNSTDSTQAAVVPFVNDKPQRFRYLLEKRQGKSIALNTGLREASGEILVFTDDDCIPNCDWLASIAREFELHPSLSVVGGRVELYNNQDRPVSIRTASQRTIISSPDELFSLLIGCNMAIHRRVFTSIQGFDPLLGPGSKRNAVFEDLDFLYRAFTHSFEIAYSPDVLVHHNHGRASDAEIHLLTRNYVVGRGAFYCKHILKSDKRVLRMAYWEISSLVKGFLRGLFAGNRVADQGRVLWELLVGAVYRLSEN